MQMLKQFCPHTATHCNTLQHTATHYNTPKRQSACRCWNSFVHTAGVSVFFVNSSALIPRGPGYMWRDSFTHVWHDSFTRDMTHSHVRASMSGFFLEFCKQQRLNPSLPLLHVTWLICMCDVTHSHLCVTWLYVWCESFICVSKRVRFLMII